MQLSRKFKNILSFGAPINAMHEKNFLTEFYQNIDYETRLTHLCRPVRSTFAVGETASLGIMGPPRVPPLNPSESIVLSEHYRL